MTAWNRIIAKGWSIENTNYIKYILKMEDFCALVSFHLWEQHEVSNLALTNLCLNRRKLKSKTKTVCN